MGLIGRIGPMTSVRGSILLTCMVVMISGCGRQKAASAPAGERSGLSRLFSSADYGPQFGWDGLNSTVLMANTTTADEYAKRGQAVLAQLGFTIGDTSIRKAESELRVNGINSSGLTAEVAIANKPQGKLELRAKVGVVGDRSGSERVLNEMLKASPQKN